MSIIRVKGRLETATGTAAEWAASNKVLLNGELGIETDTKYVKCGDGSTVWNDLEYIRCPSDVTCSVQASAGSSVWIEVPWENVYIANTSPTGTDVNVIEITT